jgi:death-on-curing protein
MDTPRFPTLDQVHALHHQSLERYRGADGVRDAGLLDAAINMPMAQFGGAYLHEELFEMAAAYLFHICQNHPYRDGSKRTALAAALVFLHANGYDCTATNDELEAITLTVARGEADKPTIAAFFERRTTPRA